MTMWGGRFNKSTDALVRRFNDSLPFDKRLYADDITASIAWAHALEGAGVLTKTETNRIVVGLDQVRAKFDERTFIFHESDEDIHSAVERDLTEIVGPLAGKLHTGRSRNDQVATDCRMWVMRTCDQLSKHIIILQRALLASAETNLHTPMPGYTHLQPAQPITWGFWALAHFWPLTRDRQRLEQTRARTSTLPLGSGALAGSSFPVDRAAIAHALGFNEISPSSLDAVSDRDFAADFLYSTAMIGVHLSRLSEQLILFTSTEFGFASVDEAYTTGSSLLPQKKNPDTLELTRGKAGRLIGKLAGMLATLKALPTAYDKDLQEDKEPLFDAADTLEVALPVMAGLISTLHLYPEKMAARLQPALFATDLADHLVKHDVPFREAHELVGKVVRMSEERAVALDKLSLPDLQSVSAHFSTDALEVFNIQASLARRKLVGGTAPEALQQQLKIARKQIQE